MEIAKKVKTALDETRILVLGAQILIGFQLRAAYEKLFDELPAASRYLDGGALLLMIVTLALLILPGPYHRMVEDGNDSAGFHRLVGRITALALAPFALALGIVIGIAGERLVGALGGAAAGLVMAIVAFIAWHPQAGRTGEKEQAMSEAHNIEQPGRMELHEKIDQMLTEARVVLPGAQALLGFQLAIILTETFERHDPAIKWIHGAALLCMCVTIVLLMAPAAWHRIVFGGEDSEEFHRVGSRFVTWSTVPLAIGLSADLFVVGTRIVGPAAAATAAVVVAVGLLGLWQALPAVMRRRRQAAAHHAAAAPQRPARAA
jgi:hypothetical protein